MAPSGMVLASWNAVPGDNTYGIKLGLEKALLIAMSPSSQLQTTTNSKLTERRLGEVTKVLSGVHAKESLDNLTMQIAATRESLTGIQDEQAKKEAIAKYVETLHQVTSQLEEQKLTRALAYLPPQRQTTTSYKINNKPPTTTTTTNSQTKPAVNYVTNNYYYQPPAGQTQPTTTQTGGTQTNPTQPPQTEPEAEDVIQPEVVEDITDTQDEIDQVIEELEQIADEIPAPAAASSESSPVETIEEPKQSGTPAQSQAPESEPQRGQSQGQGQAQSEGQNRGQGREESGETEPEESSQPEESEEREEP